MNDAIHSSDTPANNRQVAGQHYESKYQHWDFVNDAELGYFTGQITKYVFRWRRKKGLEDIAKAAHFAEKLHQLLACDTLPSTNSLGEILTNKVVDNFCEANKWLTQPEKDIMQLCANIEIHHGMGGHTVRVAHYISVLRDCLARILEAPEQHGYVAQNTPPPTTTV